MRPPTLSVAAFGVFRSWSSNNHESSYHISGRFASGAGRFRGISAFFLRFAGGFFAGRGLPAAASPFRHHPRATQVIWPSSKISAYQRHKANFAKVANLCPAGKLRTLPISGNFAKLAKFDSERIYVIILELCHLIFLSRAMVKAKQARRSGFPGCVPAFVFVPVPAQPPEVASASTPARTAKPPRTPRAIFTSSASICS